jgi:hypothetical protein
MASSIRGLFLWLSCQRAESQRKDQISNGFSLDGQALAQIFVCHKINEAVSQTVEVEALTAVAALT